MKNKIFFIVTSFFLGFLFAVFIQNYVYSDYRRDVVVKGWGLILGDYLKNPNKNFDDFSGNLSHVDYIAHDDNFIFIKGLDQSAILIFYRNKTNQGYQWDCITNTDLKIISDYTCH